MAKTLLLGSKPSIDLANRIKAELIEVPDIYENDLGVINDFVINHFSQEFNTLVIDADNFQRTDVVLAIGMYMRLSFTEIGMNALNPVVIVSDKRIKSFLNIKTYSQFLLTKNVYFQSRQNIILDAVSPLDPKKYQEDFLDYIHVNAMSGHHSLANEWGASVLDKLINMGKPSGNPEFSSASKKLYFKYVYAQTINVVDFLSGKQQAQFNMLNRPRIDAIGKRILLIDDEADKGWKFVLQKLIVTNENDFNVIAHRAKDYNDFSKEERNLIENGNHDLVFLDLRMNGDKEKDVYKPDDFSGMKILKQIKRKQPGLQVIMFTASNKAWNLKALLEAGADGYYIKESPEYKFSFGFSLANYDALRENIKLCLKRSFLRTIYEIINAIKKDFNQTHVNEQFKDCLINQMNVSYTLLSAMHYEYAFVSLYQIIELVNDQYIGLDDKNVWYIKETHEDAKSWSINFKHECVESKFSDEDKRKFPEWKKISCLYYQLWKQEDKMFGYKVQKLINERNKFMHNESNKNSQIHSESGYFELLDIVKTICHFI